MFSKNFVSFLNRKIVAKYLTAVYAVSCNILLDFYLTSMFDAILLGEPIVRRRLYFMLPDVKHCQQLVTELQQVSIPKRDIHVVARQDIPLQGLHQASALQKTELLHGLEVGAGVGGLAGMLAGLLVIAFPPAGVVLGGGAAIIGTTLAGASFGSLVSALIARDIPNHELKAFQARIVLGEILLLLDIPTKRVEEIITLIRRTHPEAQIGIVRPPRSGQAHQVAAMS